MESRKNCSAMITAPAYKNIALTGMVLSFTAGFADTLTFTSSYELFSAHVTGNFVLLAYDLIKHSDSRAWLKLLSFPVFLLSVVVAGIIASKEKKMYFLLFTEGLLLSAVGIFIITFGKKGFIQNGTLNYCFMMVIVFAMGFQNAFGRIFMKATFAPTTVMTGNVTQVTLDIARGIHVMGFTPEGCNNIKNFLRIIGGFLTGCLAGGLLGSWLGIGVILLPGVLISLLFFEKKATQG